MHKDFVKILVLETDEPHPDTQHEKGSFADIFNHLFTKAGQSHDPPLGVELDQHFVVDDPEHNHHGHVPHASEIPEDVHAILITGSMYDAHGDDPWIVQLRELVKNLWTTRPEIKFSGVCFGHQLLARTLGAKVEPTPGERWELSHTSMDLTLVGQKLFVTNDKTLTVHQMHQDHVTTVPSSETTDLLDAGTKVHVWASTEHTEVQGLYIRDRLFTSQGHLGFDENMVHRQIELRQKSGAIGKKDLEQVREAQEKAHLEHDGEVVAAAVVRFFHGDDHDID
ncbi:Putative glutamine amidotransferase-like protein [Fulvia fulva]|uniref:Glutamine amidotransferase-like protein n=1 Tax=Passalora fulva TaxID=5499 RepID=A0A9Q8LDD6_PASFU|nr:Putative glutamine amidotransferase-like protein [Fulvia fulva]KAK4631087.1 putative glutamine amidotransferase-like protein [Fulvia fulva]UJO14633.1 Putative glutamine amidotransferase-like protein [Fulvia fulva]WPV11552.1 Putative glutamine amidotransferase-like protein [Fulvia fulva]WPV26426.1 Putative glutamine amidotransferase-like protein [Fulvia fulva]